MNLIYIPIHSMYMYCLEGLLPLEVDHNYSLTILWKRNWCIPVYCVKATYICHSTHDSTTILLMILLPLYWWYYPFYCHFTDDSTLIDEVTGSKSKMITSFLNVVVITSISGIACQKFRPNINSTSHAQLKCYDKDLTNCTMWSMYYSCSKLLPQKLKVRPQSNNTL